MFGKNAVTKPDYSHPQNLRVKEIFYTIQGEGPYAGHPAIFIRLGGCNLRCFFCDTDFESDLMEMRPDDIKASCKMLKSNGLIIISGGEPLAQDIVPLCETLVSSGYTVQIETAGTVWPPGLEFVEGVSIVCSPKTPDVHKQVAAACWHWKYIIRAGEQDEWDGLPTMSTQQEGKQQRLFRPQHGTIYVQPMDEHDDAKNECNLQAVAQAALKYGYRVSIQQHKILGVE